MILTHRISTDEDLQSIVQLPEDKISLFYMFPKATFPLTIEQLKEVINNRFDTTVFLLDDQIIGYANIYFYADEKEPYIGNVILSKDYRGKGLGKEIVKTMIHKAVSNHDTHRVNIAVFKSNISVCNLYKSLGFKEYKTEIRIDFEGNKQELVFMGLRIF